MNHRLRRALAAVVALAAITAAFPVLTSAPAGAVGTLAGAATVSPGSGTKNTTFSVNLPNGAACPGDSPNGGYRVQTYLVPTTVDPATLQFDSAGPTPGSFGTYATFRQPLYDTTGSPIVDRQTAAATNAGGPGPILVPLSANYAVFNSGNIPAGSYNIGIACTLGPAGPDQLKTFWNAKKTFTTANGDWVLGAVPPAPTLTSATAGDKQCVAAYTSPAGDPAATSYTVRATAGGTTTAAGTSTGGTVTGLTNGTTYAVTVVQANSVGTSDPSNSINCTPNVSVSVADAVVTEGNASGTVMTFPVTLSSAAVQPVSVSYTTAPGTATTADYTATSSTLTFATGESTKNITVPVTGDVLDEGDEAFTLTLSAPVNGIITRGTATGTITDDDPLPALSIADVSVTEGNATTTATFTVTLGAASGRSVTVGFSTANGSATAPGDFTATSGTLTFAPGATTQSINVPIVGDAAVEDSEAFTVVLSGPTNATLNRATATGTIANDDATPPPPPAPPAPTQGYSLVGEDGSLYAYGTAKNLGDMRGTKLNAPIIGVAYTPGGNGYWLVAKDGGIFTFGNAEFYGSMGDKTLNSPVIGMAATPTGRGYWLFAGDGGIFTFGDAEFFGSMGDQKLNQPVINMEPLESGNGYWLVAADGGIFTFGQATFEGSMGDQRINQPVFDMTSTDTDKGYWLVARDGGIFSFGDADAKFYGSAVNETPRPGRIIGMDSTPGSLGYWIADASGKVYAYGNAEQLGDRSGSANPAPIIGLAAVPGLKL